MHICGIGKTKFGITHKSLPELIYESMYLAITDSPIEVIDIDAIIVSNFLAGASQSQLHLGSIIASLLPRLNLPIFNVESACASGGAAFHMATSLIKIFDNILVIGAEKISNVTNNSLTKDIAMAGDYLRDQREGLIFPAQYAIVASQYIKKHKAKHDDLSLISLKNHKNANLNPLAHFNYMDLDWDTICSSPVVASPLQLYDCCPFSDGAASIVLSRQRLSDRDVKVIGTSLITDSISLSQRNEFTTFRSARLAAEAAYSMAKISPKDIDIAEVHDCFTIAELIALEDLGLCKRGDAIKLVRNDETSLSGRIPINTDGGLLADGHPIGATGIAQIYEIVKQLRDEADGRQISNARIGLTHNIGGAGGTAVVNILEKCQ